MNAMFPAVVALVTVLSLTPAHAEDHATTHEATTAVTTEVKTDAATPAVAATENYTLENGTSVVVENGLAFTVDAAGVRTPAPDGAHVTKEGKTLDVKAGALVPAADAKADVKTEVETDVAPADAE